MRLPLNETFHQGPLKPTYSRKLSPVSLSISFHPLVWHIHPSYTTLDERARLLARVVCGPHVGAVSLVKINFQCRIFFCCLRLQLQRWCKCSEEKPPKAICRIFHMSSIPYAGRAGWLTGWLVGGLLDKH